MTTRQQLKRAVRVDRSDTDRASVDPGPSLPERLYAARERKGVDLYRAERDTKIRARLLDPLEGGAIVVFGAGSEHRSRLGGNPLQRLFLAWAVGSAGAARGQPLPH